MTLTFMTRFTICSVLAYRDVESTSRGLTTPDIALTLHHSSTTGSDIVIV